MNWFKNLQITKKIMSGFILIAGISGAIGAFSVFEIHRISDEAEMMYLRDTAPLDNMGKIGVLMQRMRVDLREVYLQSTPEGKQKFMGKLAEIDAEIEKNLAIFEKSIHDKKVKSEFDDLVMDIKKFKPMREKMTSLALAGKNDEYMSVLHATGNGSAVELVTEINKEIEALFASKIGLAKELYDDSVSTGKMTIILATVLTGVNVLSAVLLGLFIATAIKRPVLGMRDMLKDIAQGEGDLTKRLDASSTDEIGETCKWFNTFIEKLHGIISEVSSNTMQVAAASAQLQSTAEQIATGAEEVAAQTATVATATEEMSATSNDISHNCHQAADGAEMASKIASEGSAIVDGTITDILGVVNTVKASANIINKLGESSEQIGEIISTITDIADQTNLLALNAAIEAARAGEQGRGFAVVADEVRKLAEQTTKAAKEIGGMIKTIQKDTGSAVQSMNEGVLKVEAVSHDAERSREALGNIINQIGDLNMQVNQIATAAEEQTATTHEISNNVSQITEVVHQTASGSQETATAAHQLAGLAEQLQTLVRQFKL